MFTLLTGLARSSTSGRRLAAVAPLALALAAAVGLACDRSLHVTARDKDPLASLASATQSESFDLAFWVQQQNGRTEVWRRAFAYCHVHIELPNCRTVRIATWWATPPPQTPEVRPTSQPTALQAPTSSLERSRP